MCIRDSIKPSTHRCETQDFYGTFLHQSEGHAITTVTIKGIKFSWKDDMGDYSLTEKEISTI